VGDDPNLSKALKGAKFVAVQDILETATTEIADVVFPAQAFTEREGTFVSGERRVQRFYAAVAAKGDSKPDFAITSMVAKQMGVILEGTSPSVVFDILANSVDAFNELSYDALAQVQGSVAHCRDAVTCIMAAQPMRTPRDWVCNSSRWLRLGEGEHLQGQERSGSSSKRKRIAGCPGQ
jgi:predicted molibdopterin-dependent oxidoreductase YjgC